MYKRYVHICMKETYVFVKESCTCVWCIGTGFSVLCHNESCLWLDLDGWLNMEQWFDVGWWFVIEEWFDVDWCFNDEQ